MNKLLMRMVPTAALRVGAIPFSVYTHGAGEQLELLCTAGEELKEERESLVDRCGWQVFISSEDTQAWLAYAGQDTETLIHSHLIRFEDKAEVVLSLVTRAFEELWQTPHDRSRISVCSISIRVLVDLMLHSKERTSSFFMTFSTDRYILSHAVNVASLSILIGEILYGKDRELLWKLGLAGLLHDLGIVNIDPEMINRPDDLSSSEWERIHQHPLDAYHLCQEAALPAATLAAVRSHHERMDGSGYPERLAGSDIHPYARIVAVADVYDAITSDRCYRESRQHIEALKEMAGMNHQFDPEVFDALLLIVLNNDRLVDEFRRGLPGYGIQSDPN